MGRRRYLLTLGRLAQLRFGLNLDDPRTLAQSGVDGQRDLIFSISAERLERVHQAAQQPAALLRGLRAFGQGKGQFPLPLPWIDLVLPAQDHARLEQTLTRVLRKVTGKSSLSQRGRPRRSAVRRAVPLAGSAGPRDLPAGRVSQAAAAR